VKAELWDEISFASSTATAWHQAVERGYAVLIHDLTEKKEWAGQVRRSEQSFAEAVDAIEEYGIFMLDKKGYVQTWNRGAQRIKGYLPGEIIGRHFSIFYPEEARLSHHPDKELAVAAAKGYYEEEGWRLRKDGSAFWASVTITAMRDESAALQGFVKVTRDLTARKMHELELQQARDQAQEASKLKSQFVANVSHEIRTPLAGIIGMSELLAQDQTLSSEQREAAGHILSSSERLLVVLNDILDFSKLEAGKMQLRQRPFSVVQLVEDVCHLIEPTTASKAIRIVRCIDDSLPPQLLGDEAKLRQGLLNLAQNAAKFTAQGEIQVRVQLIESDARQVLVKFSVKDTGIGVKPDVQGKLFQPFVQADGSVTRFYGGTGLGLSITKGYVDLMSGKIGYESEPGIGSEFWFIVPLQVVA
jgi:PAS domain S-box-containing protein